MKYPWVEKLGLCVLDLNRGYIMGPLNGQQTTTGNPIIGVVYANDLERLLESAKTVYGWGLDDHGEWAKSVAMDETHSAKLICIEKIKKGVSKEEILEFIKSVGYSKLADRIESEGIID